MPSSTSTSILTPNGSNYDDTYTIYTLPVFSFDDTAPQAAYTKLAPFEPGTFTVPSTVSSVIFAGGTTPPPAFAIGQYEIPYTLWYAVGQWASWYKDYFFSDRDIMSDAQKVAHVGNVGTVQQLTDNAAAFKTGRRGSASAGGAPPLADDYQPVTYIDWRDAALWCNAYTELLNAAASNGWTANWDPGLGTLSPEFAGGGSLDLAYGNGSDLKKVTDFPTDTYTAITLAASNKTGYRLPDEAEWEYAARGGSHATTPASGWSSPYGAGGAVGWYQGNAAGQTNPIGTTTAGFFSFTAGNVSYTVYDMIGNVAEWTNKIATPVDHLPTEIATANITENTYNEASCLTGRLVRGGSYDSDTRDCKLGFDRIAKSPGQARSGSVGFRIARSN
jgi:formylglycine-generating enzyme required for sulfatase activity